MNTAPPARPSKVTPELRVATCLKRRSGDGEDEGDALAGIAVGRRSPRLARNTRVGEMADRYFPATLEQTQADLRSRAAAPIRRTFRPDRWPTRVTCRPPGDGEEPTSLASGFLGAGTTGASPVTGVPFPRTFESAERFAGDGCGVFVARLVVLGATKASPLAKPGTHGLCPRSNPWFFPFSGG